jgi:hypothetical protein
MEIVKLMFVSQKWEHRYGAVQISVKTFEKLAFSKDDESFKIFKEFLFEKSYELLIDEEFRVRNSIGDIMQKLIEIDGSRIYEEFKDHLIKNIQDTFKRDPKGNEPSSKPCKFLTYFHYFGGFGGF